MRIPPGDFGDAFGFHSGFPFPLGILLKNVGMPPSTDASFATCPDAEVASPDCFKESLFAATAYSTEGCFRHELARSSLHGWCKLHQLELKQGQIGAILRFSQIVRRATKPLKTRCFTRLSLLQL